MAYSWFRMYAEFATDPKVQMMTETLQRRFIMLMCMRCGNDSETFHDEEVTFQLRISEEETAATKAVFVAKGFVDDEWRLLNWDKRQYSSDSSTARVREHRERKKHPAPKNETVGNVSVTPPDTEQNRTETEQKDQNPPADKRQAAPEPDERHVACRLLVHAYWHHRHPAEQAAPWDGSEAKALTRLLKAKPDLTPERFRQLLACRERSEVNHDERPRAWLERLTDYAGGPLDRFKQPAPVPVLQPGMRVLTAEEGAREEAERERERLESEAEIARRASRTPQDVEAEERESRAREEASELAYEEKLRAKQREFRLTTADACWLEHRMLKVRKRQQEAGVPGPAPPGNVPAAEKLQIVHG